MSKTNKRRHCPATQRVIRAAECAENRISRYNCAADCPFNPFSPAQYDTFDKTESKVIEKAINWFASSSPDRAQAVAQLSKHYEKGQLEGLTYQIATYYFNRGADGRTYAERWAAAGFPTLNNDERIIQSAFMQMRIRLVEVHRILDDRRIEVVDLLEPTPTEFVVCDRSLAAMACRFTTMLAWFYPLPHFWRCLDIALYINPVGPYEPLEAVKEIVRHLGGPAARDKWNEWFAHNLLKFYNATRAVSFARNEQALANTDATVGKVIYQLRAPFETCRQILDGIAAVAPDEPSDRDRNNGFNEARFWFDESDQAIVLANNVRPVLGRILLAKTHWQLEAIGRERFLRLKAQFERVFGDKVHFQQEILENPNKNLMSEQLEYDPALIPPKLLTQPDKFVFGYNRVETNGKSLEQLDVDIITNRDRAWLDEPLPALDGKTPRQAAIDPTLRPSLIKILKDRVRTCDEMNLKKGWSIDVNWMLKELGVHEIIFDPPPPRPRQQETEDEPDDASDDFFHELKPWPPLPKRPFNEEEAIERLRSAWRSFKIGDRVVEAMEAAGGSPIDHVYTLVEHALNQDQLAFLATLLTHVWFAFVPPGCYGPRIEPEEVERAFHDTVETFKLAHKSSISAAVHYLLEEGPQPEIVKAVNAYMIEAWDDFLPNDPLKEGASTVVMLVVKAIVELLDAKCRRSGRRISRRR